ncbi:uncharacterized protein LOC127753825 [Oryza glaberrima]|uniref:uncharacterized protein LOC127753825 n=1 Tax=Oryza glaberrima TaxID=4538 RepID=UPI00224BFB1C|nr:uncharacterized protein LOC127753825 [Oryza glaberrima]
MGREAERGGASRRRRCRWTLAASSRGDHHKNESMVYAEASSFKANQLEHHLELPALVNDSIMLMLGSPLDNCCMVINVIEAEKMYLIRLLPALRWAFPLSAGQDHLEITCAGKMQVFHVLCNEGGMPYSG